MAITYSIKGIFLILSWLSLFTGIEKESFNNQIFFTSILIYTASVLFDLIFLCIENNAQVNTGRAKVFKSSLGLAIANGLVCIFAFMGIINAIYINKDLKIKVTSGGFTTVYPEILKYDFPLSYVMIFIIFLGIGSIIPGFVVCLLKMKEQENNSD